MFYKFHHPGGDSYCFARVDPKNMRPHDLMGLIWLIGYTKVGKFLEGKVQRNKHPEKTPFQVWCVFFVVVSFLFSYFMKIYIYTLRIQTPP